MQSILLTIASALAIVVVTAIFVGWPLAQALVAWLSEQQLFARSLYELVRYGVGAGVLFTLTVTLYILLPNIELRLRDVLPGAVFAVVVWILVAEAFSWYLRNFARYSVVYGSLAGIVLTLLFFYISAAIFIFGALFNSALLEARTAAARAKLREPEGGRET